MAINRQVLLTGIVIYFCTQILLLIYIQFPRVANFDEYHYVPAAREFLNWNVNRNWEHPPLGKYILALGMAIGGDRPFGWRVMSTFFGAWTLVGMFALALTFFKGLKPALLVTGLCLVNGLFYVQARVGMLEIFMTCFMIWGLVFFSRTWKPALSKKDVLKKLTYSGVCFGLGAACKWFAFVPWAICLGMMGIVKLFQTWGVVFHNTASDRKAQSEWYDPSLFREVRYHEIVLYFIALPLFAYFLTFVPLLFLKGQSYTILDLFRAQYRIWDGQLRVLKEHPYMSHWSQWPLLHRPMWYAFDKEGLNKEWVRGVMMLGNPLIMWAGVLSVGFCIWDFIHTRSRAAFLLLCYILGTFASWMVIPRKVAFYYYYFPTGMLLSLSLVYFFWSIRDESSTPTPFSKFRNYSPWVFLAAATCLFIYFWPILAAWKIPVESYRNWMWFRSWI